MRILVSLFVLFACSMVSYAQDTVFYKNPRLRVNEKMECDYYSLFSIEKGGVQKEVSYSPKDVKKSESYFTINNGEKSREGEWKTWYENGALKSIEHFKNDTREGALITYWENGKKKRSDLFKNDSLVSGQCFNNEGVDIAHYPYELKPQFPGGEEKLKRYLMKKIHYPQTLDRIEGMVLARFIVTETGKITAVETLNVSHDLMQQEVVRVIKRMPKWEPGKLDGVPVSAYYVLPVSFTIMPLEGR